MRRKVDKFYDVIIIGCGIGGLFTAYTLLKSLKDSQVLILEKGKGIEERVCPQGTVCSSCPYCSVLSGVGGAGGFSDGKITLVPSIGTHQESLLNLLPKTILAYIRQVHKIIQEAVPHGIYYGVIPTKKTNNIEIMGYEGYHIGTDGVRVLVKKIYNKISKYCNILLQSEVIDVQLATGNNGQYSITYKYNDKIRQVIGDYLIIATGLEGAVFTEKILKNFSVIPRLHNSDIGIRIETHYKVFEELMNNLYDFKIYYKDTGIDLRTFCVNHQGYVLTESHIELGIKGVNGHSYIHNKTPNTNFAILATISLEQSNDPPIFVRDLAKAINRECQGYPAYQDLDEFLGNRSRNNKKQINKTNGKIRYGNIKKFLPNFLYTSFRDFLLKLINFFPLIREYQTYVYAPEIKYFQYKVPLTPWAHIPYTNIYVIGNASGYTANLMGAAVMGVIAGRDISIKLKRHK